MGDQKTRTEPSKDSGSQRKAYRAPRLTRLGTLSEITAAVGMTSQKNDGSHGNAKTS
jgi:hypothetical protein